MYALGSVPRKCVRLYAGRGGAVDEAVGPAQSLLPVSRSPDAGPLGDVRMGRAEVFD